VCILRHASVVASEQTNSDPHLAKYKQMSLKSARLNYSCNRQTDRREPKTLPCQRVADVI